MHFNTLNGWLEWQEGLHPKPIDLGLERVDKVFRMLNPKSVTVPTITVAGTNGKGSCIAFIEAIYRAQGYRIGTYTSPHLLKYNERIKIDGKPVEDSVICAAFERIEAVRGNTSLSYFEFGTLAALDIFWRAGLDVQLLEVGLGGRLDAVNIINADVSVITSICIDHCDWLGETREAIGREKAGIFRKGIPAIIGDPDPPDSLEESATAIDAPVFRVGREFNYQIGGSGWDWHYDGKDLTGLPIPGLKGDHQYRNASAILLAIHFMGKRLPVDEASIRRGIAEARLKGRFQLIEGEIPVLLDVGHNPQAVTALAGYLSESFSDRRIRAVFVMMKNKDIRGVVEIMKPIIYDWYISPLSNPRTASEQMIREAFNQCELTNATFGYSGFKTAFGAARSNAVKGDLILVFGSFFLVSEYLMGIENGECDGN